MKNNSIRRYKTNQTKIDPFYSSIWVGKFINNIMKKGNKTFVEKQWLIAQQTHRRKEQKDLIFILLETLIATRPLLELKARKIGRGRRRRQIFLAIATGNFRRLRVAIRWMGQALRSYPGHSLADKMIEEFQLIQNGMSTVNTKQKHIITNTLANRTRLRYKWMLR